MQITHLRPMYPCHHAMLIRCCWTSSMEQSASQAARVRLLHSDNFGEHSKHIWQLQRRVTVFFSCAVYKLAYLLTYLLS